MIQRLHSASDVAKKVGNSQKTNSNSQLVPAEIGNCNEEEETVGTGTFRKELEVVEGILEIAL